VASEIKVSSGTTGFSEAINQMLEETLAENEEALRAHVKDACKVARDDLRKTSPRRKSGETAGDYAKGWSYAIEETAEGAYKGTVYNKTDYQLTHLLEKGHAKRNGGRVAAIPHIEPAFEDARKVMEEGTT
jgi:hypothetical protein